jgi:hypothetical protein
MQNEKPTYRFFKQTIKILKNRLISSWSRNKNPDKTNPERI